MQRIRSAVSASIAFVAALAAAGAVTAAPASAGTVPNQYIAKVYSEGLGRAPDASGWAASVRQFTLGTCDVAGLTTYGKTALTSSEFLALPYDNTSRMLAAYRTILNRDPVAVDLANAVRLLDSRAVTWSAMLDSMFASPEFASLASAICSTSSPDYDFGITPAPDVPTLGSGFTGTQAALQATLNATPRGGVVTLAQRAVVRMSSTLTIPAGVTLRTTGSPGTSQYANMARLVRADSWPTFAAAVVTLQPGARLDHVWVDGQMGTPDPGGVRRYASAAFNVRVLGGTGTTVSDNRLGNAAGATAISAGGGGDSGVTACVDNEYSRNFIEGYASDHDSGNWTDGVSVGCEDAEVTGNTIVDATDVPLIVFGQDGYTQRSRLDDNVIANPSQSSFAALGVDAWNAYPRTGDGPGVSSRDFTGSTLDGNLFWNTLRSTHAIGITVGTRAWTGSYNYSGRGMAVRDNTRGSFGLYARTGIVVAGMHAATVTGNSLPDALVDDTSSCARAAVGAAVTAGYASGTIQGPYLDTDYSACIG
ncbi:MAG TPA: hypothetical protein VLK58_15620 [Conexibacter sp.]|nr:hypothetical protein [Conexibacter sp.]